MIRKMCAISLLLASARLAAADLYITTENSPPFNMQQGQQIVGSATDKVRELMARAGIGYRIELLSWLRAYTLAQHTPDTCVYSTTRTPERESLFKWVGPLSVNDWVFFGVAGHAFKLAGIEDARPLRIGTYNGDVRDVYLRAHGYNVEAVQNDISNPRKLLLNRIDLWASSSSTGSTMVAENGWTGRIVPLLTFNTVELYLACNPAVPDATIRLLNQTLQKMNRDGTSKSIDRKYENGAPAP